MQNSVSNPSPDFSVFHPIEKAILNKLDANKTESIETLMTLTGLGIDQIRRGIEWLKLKNLISVQDRTVVWYSLEESGRLAAEKGLPERRLVNAIKSGLQRLADIARNGLLDKNEVNAAVAVAKRAGWIQFGEGGMLQHLEAAEALSDEEQTILMLKARDR